MGLLSRGPNLSIGIAGASVARLVEALVFIKVITDRRTSDAKDRTTG